MAYALVGTIGAASQGAASAAVTPAWGTSENRDVGNLLILFVSVDAIGTLPAAPSGWSIGFRLAQSTACSANIFYKIAAGADAAPTVAAITSGVIAAQLAEFSGNTGSPIDKTNGQGGTASPITCTLSAADITSGELLVMAGADFRSAARSPNDTWTSNSGTVTAAGNNNGVSSANHYSFGYILATTQNASADTAIMTCSVTTSITGLAVVGVSFSPQGISELIQQPLVPAYYRRYF